MSKETAPPSENSEAMPDPMTEPSVLDWVKSLIRGRPISIPEIEQATPTKEVDEVKDIKKKLKIEPIQEAKVEPKLEPELEPKVEPSVEPKMVQKVEPKVEPRAEPTIEPEIEPKVKPRVEPKVVERRLVRIKMDRLRLPLALAFACFAQFRLENRAGEIWISIGFYILAAILAGWALWVGDCSLTRPSSDDRPITTLRLRIGFLIPTVVFSYLTYLNSSGNRFRVTTVIYWIAALLSLVLALWEGEFPLVTWWSRLRIWMKNPSLHITLDGWKLIVLFGFGVSLYFRIVHLASVPPEMTSDQAEKLLDVMDVLNGQYSIFFIRNTGREALQFYLAAATSKFLGTGISYITLKIGTVLAGILTLPYIYLLGKEVGGKKVGLVAMVLAGMAYWPNVISRVGLRFPLYPLFVAPAMYYLVRGLRRRTRNDLLLCGLAMGIGFHGYSPARVIPILVAFGVGIYLLHTQERSQRWAVFTWLIGAGLVTLIVIIPLLRAAVEIPDYVVYRMVTRLGSKERPLPGSPLLIFLSNVWNALRMFAWDNGVVWVDSIPHRPALDWVTGGLFHLGVVLLVVRYVRKRNWQDIFLFLSIPILQLPSTLSLAFPSENPALNRAGGAIVPAFIIAALSLVAIHEWAQEKWEGRWKLLVSPILILFLFYIAAGANYALVFDEYAAIYQRSAWNTGDAGQVIRAFAESIGDYDTAYVVGYPHWMDTRLVGIHAGQPTKDYAIWPGDFERLFEDQRAQLLILKPEDVEALARLKELFPHGTVSRWTSEIEGKDFLIYFIPPAVTVDS